MASWAPALEAACAIAHAIERLLATPTIRPVLPVSEDLVADAAVCRLQCAVTAPAAAAVAALRAAADSVGVAAAAATLAAAVPAEVVAAAERLPHREVGRLQLRLDALDPR